MLSNLVYRFPNKCARNCPNTDSGEFNYPILPGPAEHAFALNLCDSCVDRAESKEIQSFDLARTSRSGQSKRPSNEENFSCP